MLRRRVVSVLAFVGVLAVVLAAMAGGGWLVRDYVVMRERALRGQAAYEALIRVQLEQQRIKAMGRP